MEKKAISLFILFFVLFSTHSYATWSIIAVDRKTGEIGIVGASCTFDVSGIASIEPGKGAIVVQASSNYFARMRGVSLMENNASAQEILAAMKAKRFEPEQQQYGVVLLKEGTRPLVYSGTEIADWNGEMIDEDFAVMGNILFGEQVVKKAYDAFNQNRDKSLAERLMLALKAGEEAGGDKRCGTQYARSAFIMVYKPKDGAILKLAIQGIEEGGKPAVTLLHKKFEFWRKEEKDKK
ncbi:DUF1028 domain-containing protein [Spongiimicrobium salis]|uniref:DUF1028 domain-containing protein n=1 Tax=Spongiimicrobium salis TaxID=1667022 RepID=UPI00374D7A52